MQVHKGLGAGFLESVYHEALEREFSKKGIPFKSKQKMQVYYNDEPLDKYFVADFICYDKIIVELKAAAFLHKNFEAQTINYVKSTNHPLGLLVNLDSQVWSGNDLLTHRNIEISREQSA